MNAEFWGQVVAVIRIELRKTVFARRTWGIYLLALLPAVLFYINSVHSKSEHVRLANIAATHPLAKDAVRSIRPGMTDVEVIQKLGEPYQKVSRKFWLGRPPVQHDRTVFSYTDGETDASLLFNDGKLQNLNRRPGQTLDSLLVVFASVFQLYFIRLAIFFGCAAVFTNLFRGELLDKSLHFYLLAPVPRPALVLGKYIAGLCVTAVVFALSTALQFLAMLRGFAGSGVSNYLQHGGWDQIGAYMSVSVLACAVYGSIFLAAGLIASNPTVPAAVILLWESINGFLPGSLKMMSVVFYLQSLCPIEAPADRSIPPLFRALVSPGQQIGIFTDLAVIVGLAALALWLSSLEAHKLEINYSAD